MWGAAIDEFKSRLDDESLASWVTLEYDLDQAGLADPLELDLLLEVAWRLCHPLTASTTWGGLNKLNALGSPDALAPNLNRGTEPTPEAILAVTAAAHCSTFCDLRSPRRPEAFNSRSLSRADRARLVAAAERSRGRLDARVLLPVLVAAQFRRTERWADVLPAVDRVLAVPRRLTLVDRRRMHWLAEQVHGGWMNGREAARYLVERFAEPFRDSEVVRWEAVMPSGADTEKARCT